MYHEVNNASDYEPICVKLNVDAEQYSTQPKSYVSKVAWYKAKQHNLDAYSRLLQDKLAKLDVPYSAVLCRNLNCKDDSHCCSLMEYTAAIYRLHVYQQENRHCHIPQHGRATDESPAGRKMLSL